MNDNERKEFRPVRTEKTLLVSRYNHGGGRVFFEDPDKIHRELVADTYQIEDREIIISAILLSLRVPSSHRGNFAFIAHLIEKSYDMYELLKYERREEVHVVKSKRLDAVEAIDAFVREVKTRSQQIFAEIEKEEVGR